MPNSTTQLAMIFPTACLAYNAPSHGKTAVSGRACTIRAYRYDRLSPIRPSDDHSAGNLHRLFLQFLHFFVGERENVALFLRHIFNLHLLAVLWVAA